ncbi:hypothetical protein FRB90_003592 [Tulasnella sp. 427]|nr:hypothetical protein FRB90_003592 [Tulasnella sp. 427]
MNHPGPNTHNQAIFELPIPPDEFGQDGGNFYRCYDTLAEEIDDDMVKGLKEQLDGLLIFAGLFAGVNSAFLALTLPLMSADPTDDTNALLRQNNAILMQLALGRNDSLPSALPLPSEGFSPAGQILIVNVLFSVSLTLALLSSFLAVIGRQWLVYYRKRSGGGPDRQRWEQLKRFLGAQRWGLEWILDDFLPSLLQIGLIIFSISLTIYMGNLHSTLSTVVGVLMCAGLAILVVTALLAIWDQSSPFQSPLSRFIPWAILGSATIAICSAAAFFCLLEDFHSLFVSFFTFLFCIIKVVWNAIRHLDPLQRNSGIVWMDTHYKSALFQLCQSLAFGFIESVSHFLKDKEAGDQPTSLQVTTVKRVICTSDDPVTLLHAASNLLSVTDPMQLSLLAQNGDFSGRLAGLCHVSFNSSVQLAGRGRENLATAITWVYRAAMGHIILSEDYRNYFERHANNASFSYARAHFSSHRAGSGHGIPSVILQSGSHNLIDGTLGYRILCDSDSEGLTHTGRFAVWRDIELELEGLLNGSWRRISLSLLIIRYYWAGHPTSLSLLLKAYRGDHWATVCFLQTLLEDDKRTACSPFEDLTEHIVNIFKALRNAILTERGDFVLDFDATILLLRLSEQFLRDNSSSYQFEDVGRDLRRTLIAGLLTVGQRRPVFHRPYK